MIHFSWEHLKSSNEVAKTTHLKDGLFSWKSNIPALRDISVPTNWNEYKFFSMTQKILEICDGHDKESTNIHENFPTYSPWKLVMAELKINKSRK